MESDSKVILDFVKTLAHPQKDISEATLLFTDKLLDSLSLAELVGFLEDVFKIKVNPMDIVADNLDSVNKMTGFVQRKRR